MSAQVAAPPQPGAGDVVVCVHCRDTNAVRHNSGTSFNAIYYCANCDKHFTRGDVDGFLKDWDAALESRRAALAAAAKRNPRRRDATPDEACPPCPSSTCGGVTMRSWRGNRGVDEVFRCGQCCRPYAASELAKLFRAAASAEAAARKRDSAKADAAPVLEVSADGFDMDDLDVPDTGAD